MANSNVPLTPTFFGHIATTLDALVLFEGCLDGSLQHVPRRPHDRERHDLIKSGNVFVYEEHSSGIKRWTDGVAWSPSRILGNFLIYRELDRPFPPGEKKRAMKRNKKTTTTANGVGKPSEVGSRQANVNGATPNPNMGMGDGSGTKDAERALIGSLVDSYPFKDNGLVKKTISVSYNGIPHHLVSYYNVDDVTSGKLLTPSRDPHLSATIPRGELVMSQNFRAPIDEVDLDENRGHGSMFPPHHHAYQVNSHHPSISRTMSVPSIHHPLSAMSSAQFSHQSYMQTPYLGSVPGQVGGYAQQHHSYPQYELGRASRYASSAGIPQDMSRSMAMEPHQHRRHSTAYESGSGAEMGLGTLPAMSDPTRSMGGNYNMTPIMYTQPRVPDLSPHDAYPTQSPRTDHPESGLGSDRTSQGMAFDGITRSDWNSFDQLEEQNPYLAPNPTWSRT